MLVTLTPNPSIDATLEISALVRGEVARATSARREAGGKGINVAHAAAKAGYPATAIAPCGEDDPFAPAARALGINFVPVAVSGKVRTNTALTEGDGTTTKVNESGPTLTPEDLAAMTATVATHARHAAAVVLAGSLPPGAPEGYYADAVAAIRAGSEALIAVDTSDAPLVALGERLDERTHPDILKPNAFELAQLTGANGHELEDQAAAGDVTAVISAARTLVERGVGEVLVTLGGAGACLVTADGSWVATPPPITVRSTVGAGDSSLAGYIMARIDGADPAECLRRAVAYGSAAAALPGTGIPVPAELDLANTIVSPLASA